MQHAEPSGPGGRMPRRGPRQAEFQGVTAGTQVCRQIGRDLESASLIRATGPSPLLPMTGPYPVFLLPSRVGWGAQLCLGQPRGQK